ncbi:membrane protein [Sphingomonas metalli]|uniref:Membrane protein n=1 Tax=Sphingomonas metalli TaxID=1779358 RepID=A0A916WYD8_9SPHN|nr:TolC family outer membrane protein [Sphingomonas metalli]GGB43468.1 membrane protein [Sphingomonas metalli]
MGFTLIAAALAATAAEGETLRQALQRAYRTNPTLMAARASLRATDEGVPLAKAAARPALSATADYQEFVVRSANSFVSPLRAASTGANVTFPLYQGGGVRAAIRAADARVLVGRANLRSTEADVFTAVVSAYMDVIRDDAIVALNRTNVHTLEITLQASRDRFEVGDLTRTDVAQSEARLALARGQLQTVEAQLDASRENYTRFVGIPPADLQPPPPLPGMPGTIDQAIITAVENNPALLASKQQARAAGYDISVAKATRLPKLSLVGSSNYNNYLGTLGSSIGGRTFQQAQRTTTVGVSLALPLYQGGAPGARVRQAQALASQSLEQIVATERGVVADVRAAFSRYRATQGVTRSAEVAVKANELALEGTRAENSVGTRTVLEVLNAQQELLNSRVQLVTAQRDAYVAGFALRAAMGRAEARDLGLFGDSLFDPTVDYTEPRARGIPAPSGLTGDELPEGDGNVDR